MVLGLVGLGSLLQGLRPLGLKAAVVLGLRSQGEGL